MESAFPTGVEFKFYANYSLFDDPESFLKSRISFMEEIYFSTSSSVYYLLPSST